MQRRELRLRTGVLGGVIAWAVCVLMAATTPAAAQPPPVPQPPATAQPSTRGLQSPAQVAPAAPVGGVVPHLGSKPQSPAVYQPSVGPDYPSKPAVFPNVSKVHSAWLPFWNMDAAYASVIRNRDVLATASPFWYYTPSCTTLVGYSGAGDTRIIDGLHAAGLRVVPTIVTDLGPAEFAACMGDPGLRAAHVQAIVAMVMSRAYDGVDFDYENIVYTTDPGLAGAVRAGYTALVTETCAAVHARGRTCTATVMAKTSDAPVGGAGVFDYRAVGAVVDRFRVMAYDEHWAGGPPGPVAGYPWVSAVAAYTRSTVTPRKVELGVPFYGRDWGGGPRARTITGDGGRALAAAYGATVSYDPVQRESTFSYYTGGVWHQVWFATGRSVGDRVDLATSMGFAGATFWAAGQEASDVWPTLRGW